MAHTHSHVSLTWFAKLFATMLFPLGLGICRRSNGIRGVKEYTTKNGDSFVDRFIAEL